jgi:hypothetical protein
LSNSSKGAELERKAKQALEATRFRVHRTIRTPFAVGGGRMASHNNDVFGVFDLIATRADRMVYVQVTVLEGMSARRTKAESVAGDVPNCHCISVEIWGWIGGRVRAKEPRGAHPAQCFRVSRWDPVNFIWYYDGYIDLDGGWFAPFKA